MKWFTDMDNETKVVFTFITLLVGGPVVIGTLFGIASIVAAYNGGH